MARLRNDGRAALLWSLRITAAAVASYVVATLLFPGTQPLLAPLTAMLVVQVTPVSLLASGIDRVVAVVAGVSLAVAFASVVPLQWWSLGLLILLAITVGQVLHLRSNLIEVAISGMLVLGVGSLVAESAAWQRLAETLVGAAVGIAVNLLWPPKVASADAGQAINGLADSMSELLDRAADELTDLVVSERDVAAAARHWLGDARRITHDIPPIGAALLHAEQGRRLNVRAVGTPDVGPGLRQGLEALEHSAIALRGMFRAVVDAAADIPSDAPSDAPSSAPSDTPSDTPDHRPGPDPETVRELWLGLAQTLRELASGVDAFGQLVRDEAEPSTRVGSADIQGLREALEGLHEARARLDDLLMAGGPPELLELHAAVLSTVKRLLREMDLDERVRRQVQLLPPTRPRWPRSGAPRSSSRAPAAGEPTPEAETQVIPPVPGDRGEKGRP